MAGSTPGQWDVINIKALQAELPSRDPKTLASQRAQREADAAWAQDTWKAKGGDKKATTFEPDFPGQSYEQQVAAKKTAKKAAKKSKKQEIFFLLVQFYL